MKFLFTVHDKATNTFTAPMTIDSERDAIEGFRQVVNQKDHQFNKFPTDFTLFQIGNFDQFTGKISIYEEKQLVTNAAALLNLKGNHEI